MDQTSICPYCNERPLGRRSDAKTCGDKACQRARNRETNKIAYDTAPEAHAARVRATRAALRVEKSCATCRGTFPGSITQSYCSLTCANLARSGGTLDEYRRRKEAGAREAETRRVEREARMLARTCSHCDAPMLDAPRSARTCSAECRSIRQAQAYRKSPLRRAWEAADMEMWAQAIQSRCDLTSSECWEWQGESRGGYPVMTFAKRKVFVHRMSLEMKLGRGLGIEAAHHICANAICVNPHHLQPVSARENMAEMIQRNYFVKRIAELEAEVARLDPSSAVLTENIPRAA